MEAKRDNNSSFDRKEDGKENSEELMEKDDPSLVDMVAVSKRSNPVEGGSTSSSSCKAGTSAHHSVDDIQALYAKQFSPRQYHDTYYLTLDEELKFFIKCYHEAFTKESVLLERKADQRHLLDFGCGPVPIYTATAGFYATTATLSDILPENRNEIAKWMKAETDALDWSLYLDYISTLKNLKSGAEVAHQLRNVYKEVVPCQDLHTPSTHGLTQWDVVMTTLVLEFATNNLKDYSSIVADVAALVLPGGVLLMAGALENTWYDLGSCQYPSVSLQEEDICSAVKSAGLEVVKVETLGRQTTISDRPADHKGVYFIIAHKSSD